MSILPAVLLAVCTALPAAARGLNISPADSTRVSPLTNAVLRAVAEQRLKQNAAADEICAACGETILDENQHCQAKNFTGRCSSRAQEPASQTDEPIEPGECPVCKESYTTDEKYHGVPHVCPPTKKASPVPQGPTGGEPECGVIFMETPKETVRNGGNGGEPETEFFFVISEQETPSLGGNAGEPGTPSYEVINPEAFALAQELWQADKNTHNGREKHSLQYYYKKVSKTK